jgi:hypothetical protein
MTVLWVVLNLQRSNPYFGVIGSSEQIENQKCEKRREYGRDIGFG